MSNSPQVAERLALRDGTALTIRPARPDDRERIMRAFAGLDRESVYTRYFTYKGELSEDDLAHLDAMDFAREAILVATVEGEQGEAIVASCRYVVCGPSTAEVAFTVEEDYQGRGIAGRMLARLAELARVHGIARFEAVVLRGNQSMLRVFERSGFPTTKRREEGTVVLTLTL